MSGPELNIEGKNIAKPKRTCMVVHQDEKEEKKV